MARYFKASSKGSVLRWW